MKKALLAVGGLLLLMVLIAAAVIMPAFIGLKPFVDGTKYADGTATLVADGYVSLMVLDADPGAVALIDCGNDPKGTAILAALKARSLGPEAVKAVFLTHGHPDHIAACHLFTGAQIYAFGPDVKLASGEARGKGPLPKMIDTNKESIATVTQVLTDGQVVDVGALQVKAYLVPGHTGGSAVFLSKGVLYLGDSAAGKSDGKSIKPAPWLFSDDPAQNVAELKKLHARLKAENADVKTMVFSHAGSLDGADALLTADQ